MKQVPETEVELIAEIERLEADARAIVEHRQHAQTAEDRAALDRQVEELNARVEFLKAQLDQP